MQVHLAGTPTRSSWPLSPAACSDSGVRVKLSRRLVVLGAPGRRAPLADGARRCRRSSCRTRTPPRSAVRRRAWRAPRPGASRPTDLSRRRSRRPAASSTACRTRRRAMNGATGAPRRRVRPAMRSAAAELQMCSMPRSFLRLGHASPVFGEELVERADHRDFVVATRSARALAPLPGRPARLGRPGWTCCAGGQASKSTGSSERLHVQRRQRVVAHVVALRATRPRSHR